MKNITIKVIILLFALAGAGALVLLFMRGASAPPEILQRNSNAHELIQAQALGLEWSLDNPSDVQKQYLVAKDLIDRLGKDGHWTDKTRGLEQTDTLFTDYARRIFSLFEAKLSSRWTKRDLDNYARRVDFIAQETNLDGDILASRCGFLGDVSRFRNLRQAYRDASAVAYASFRSVEQAREVLSKARSFRSHEYLSHCSDLEKALQEENLRERLHRSHVRYLYNLYSTLRGLYQASAWDKERLRSTAERLYTATREYDDVAGSLYGFAEDTEEIYLLVRLVQ